MASFISLNLLQTENALLRTVKLGFQVWALGLIVMGDPQLTSKKNFIRRNKKKRNYIMNCAIHEGESPSP